MPTTPRQIDRVRNAGRLFDINRPFIVGKAMDRGGVTINGGDPFDPEGVHPHRLKQLFDGRYIRHNEDPADDAATLQALEEAKLATVQQFGNELDGILTPDQVMDLLPEDTTMLTDDDWEALDKATTEEEIHAIIENAKVMNAEISKDALEAAQADIRKNLEEEPPNG